MMSMSGPFAGLGGMLGPAQPFATQPVAQPQSGGIEDYRNAFGQFFGMRPGQQPNLGAYRPEAFGLPFLAAMYSPFVQSFQNTGLMPQPADPFGDQVRKLTPAQQRSASMAELFKKRADAAASGDGSRRYAQLPNGTIVDSETAKRMYQSHGDKSFGTSVEYLSGAEAARRYMEKAAAYGGG